MDQRTCRRGRGGIEEGGRGRRRRSEEVGRGRRKGEGRVRVGKRKARRFKGGERSKVIQEVMWRV